MQKQTQTLYNSPQSETFAFSRYNSPAASTKISLETKFKLYQALLDNIGKKMGIGLFSSSAATTNDDSLRSSENIVSSKSISAKKEVANGNQNFLVFSKMNNSLLENKFYLSRSRIENAIKISNIF